MFIQTQREIRKLRDRELILQQCWDYAASFWAMVFEIATGHRVQK